MPIKSIFPTPNPCISLALLISLIGLSWWSIYLVRAPQARPATAPLTEFSAERAMPYVRQIAHEPHAMGTPDHARVRTYLLKSLAGLGLQPQVQEATITGPMTSSLSMSPSGAMLRVASRAGYVYNIMAQLKGTQPGKAVLLLAHYDSQPNALGAGDDGAGVAAILETIRAIRQRGPLQHDLLILFTDGEEQGLFGAKAFLRHPWAKNVGFVMNLEGRGNSGPSMTFELSAQNGWIVEQLGQAAPYPFASSLAYEVYRNLPNDTDFTIFREAGYAGINSAFLDGFVHYHKLTDSPENLSLNSLQHHGDNLLALTQHFGNIPLNRVTAPDKVFFNLAGDWLVQYPMGLDWLWMVLIGLLIVLRQTRKQTEGWPAHALISLVASLPTLFILLPVVQVLFVTFDLQLPVAPVLVLGLVLTLLLPTWLLVETGLSFNGWQNLPTLSILSLVLGFVLSGIAIRREEPTANQPLHSQVAYFMNADTKRAVWASYGLLTTDDWNRQFFSTLTRKWGFLYMQLYQFWMMCSVPVG